MRPDVSSRCTGNDIQKFTHSSRRKVYTSSLRLAKCQFRYLESRHQIQIVLPVLRKLKVTSELSWSISIVPFGVGFMTGEQAGEVCEYSRVHDGDGYGRTRVPDALIVLLSGLYTSEKMVGSHMI